MTPATPAKPKPITLRLRDWQGSPADRTLIQGVNFDAVNDCWFIWQADVVAGRARETVVVRRHRADGTYIGYATLADAGHGSSLGFDPFPGGTRIWVGHAAKGAGYVTYTIGQPDTPFTKVPLPNGDLTCDPAGDVVCVRVKDRFRGYRMSSAVAGKTELLWDLRIPYWMNRFQGHLLAGGRLWIHRDVATKGASELRCYNVKGARLGRWDTSAWGDEAEGAMVKDGWVWSVSRVGGSGPGRTVVCTPVEPI